MSDQSEKIKFLQQMLIKSELLDSYPTSFEENFYYHYSIYKCSRDLMVTVVNMEEVKFYFQKTLIELFQCILIARDSKLETPMSLVIEDALDLHEYVFKQREEEVKALNQILFEELFEKMIFSFYMEPIDFV